MIATPPFIRRRRLESTTSGSERARLRLRPWLQDVYAWLNVPRTIALILSAVGAIGLVVRWLHREVFKDPFIDLDESIWLEMSSGMAFLSVSVAVTACRPPPLEGWVAEQRLGHGAKMERGIRSSGEMNPR